MRIGHDQHCNKKRFDTPAKGTLDHANGSGPKASQDIAGSMNAILADVFALYVKTKNFHWHMSGPHFRDYHLLLDEQADQLYAMTDPMPSASEPPVARPCAQSVI